jgi:RNA polymerase sigma-32 factor
VDFQKVKISYCVILPLTALMFIIFSIETKSILSEWPEVSYFCSETNSNGEMNNLLLNYGIQSRSTQTFKMLSASDELHLLSAWQQRGEKPASDKEITAFSLMAAAIPKRALAGSQTTEYDLVQQFNIKLMKAADRFNLDQGYRFSTYAIWWVCAKIQDYKLASRSIVRRSNSADLRVSIVNLTRLDETVSNNSTINRADADMCVARKFCVIPLRLND